jgi:hypothetical protein
MRRRISWMTSCSRCEVVDSEHGAFTSVGEIQSLPSMRRSGGVFRGYNCCRKDYGGAFKFMLKVAESPKKLHIIAAKDTGTAEKNIINKDLGIVDDFGVLVEYNGNGTKDDKIPHILFHTSGGDKVIYVMGYGDKKKWQKALVVSMAAYISMRLTPRTLTLSVRLP